jgi:hypothetical protein
MKTVILAGGLGARLPEETVLRPKPMVEIGGRMAIFEHNPLNPLTRWIVSHCAFDTGAVLLWPAEVSRLFRSVNMSGTRLDYIEFFPGFLAVLRPLEPFLRWFPAGAQYCMIGTK